MVLCFLEDGGGGGGTDDAELGRPSMGLWFRVHSLRARFRDPGTCLNPEDCKVRDPASSLHCRP